MEVTIDDSKASTKVWNFATAPFRLLPDTSPTFPGDERGIYNRSWRARFKTNGLRDGKATDQLMVFGQLEAPGAPLLDAERPDLMSLSPNLTYARNSMENVALQAGGKTCNAGRFFWVRVRQEYSGWQRRP